MDSFLQEQVDDIPSNTPTTKAINDAAAAAAADDDDEKGTISEETRKINETMQAIENQVTKTFELTKSKLRDVVEEKDNGIELKIPILDDETTERANYYLGQLDSNLANVENLASSYWNKVSSKTGGFWSSMNEALDKIVALDVEESSKENEQQVIVVAGNRTEAELKNLSNDKNIYLKKKEKDNSSDTEHNFNIESDEITKEISTILQNDKDLEKLMNSIVPHDVDYKTFWQIYFTEREQILARGEERKKLLNKSKKIDNSEKKTKYETVEEVSWDDDDDDEEEEGGKGQEKDKHIKEHEPENGTDRGESPVVIEKADIPDVASVAKANEDTKIKNSEDQDDEDDDDWE
ncbi:Dos2p NDAI_0A03690 [Naumovozyma dairenensis CBS 421]|uniref:BSD domain-containing protein n=1 Tax=Naumovozyma dairenensis (strain ATCC 10597 / BCRC 20456 / CBS 421 / NBRC 0211 / NRRL Y-12639) TaxID=1071378 RepID=G0W3Y8_NAUDC|nr:hypothetical protein NDAI_0A03690 [Naumovozyma dairenensis CBS 421]CCD22526.1 hypothetical protein NDAI_0A03690 [Naumovozyma dairenensis CBS 421]